MGRRALCAMAFLLGVIPCGHSEDKTAGDEHGIVRLIEVRGNTRTPTERILGLIQTKVGHAFDQKTWDRDWHALVETSLFLNVRVTGALPLPNGVKLVMDVVEMPPIVVKSVKVTGVEEGVAKFLSEGLTCRPGKEFDSDVAGADRRRIQSILILAGRKSVVNVRVPELDGRRRVDPDEKTIRVTVIFQVSDDASPGKAGVPLGSGPEQEDQ